VIPLRGLSLKRPVVCLKWIGLVSAASGSAFDGKRANRHGDFKYGTGLSRSQDRQTKKSENVWLALSVST